MILSNCKEIPISTNSKKLRLDDSSRTNSTRLRVLFAWFNVHICSHDPFADVSTKTELRLITLDHLILISIETKANRVSLRALGLQTHRVNLTGIWRYRFCPTERAMSQLAAVGEALRSARGRSPWAAVVQAWQVARSEGGQKHGGGLRPWELREALANDGWWHAANGWSSAGARNPEQATQQEIWLSLRFPSRKHWQGEEWYIQNMRTWNAGWHISALNLTADSLSSVKMSK